MNKDTKLQTFNLEWRVINDGLRSVEGGVEAASTAGCAASAWDRDMRRCCGGGRGMRTCWRERLVQTSDVVSVGELETRREKLKSGRAVRD